MLRRSVCAPSATLPSAPRRTLALKAARAPPAPKAAKSQPKMSAHAAAHHPQLTKESINPNVVNAQYAVRGELVILADQLNSQLQKAKAEGKPHGLPFNELVYCNIGNPQQLRQKPLTFFREVLALTAYPDLIETARAAFAPDAIERAKSILSSMPGGSGAYSHSAGVEKIRQDVAKFIEERDGFPSDANDIFMTNGASPAIQNVLSMIIRSKSDGIMIPIPQYPLYTASIALFGGTAVEYELDEDNGWALRAADLEAAIEKAKHNHVTPRALVIINPGNPTGQCLDVANMRDIVQVCARHNIVLLADEVYQENVYDKSAKPFHSFKKVLRQSTPDIANRVELFSFHSVSKGFTGECGRRGGYMECVNINADVKAQLYKLASISLCPNLDGQIIVDLMVRPPREGDASYAKYTSERDAIYESLKRRALSVAKSLNELEGVKCNSAEGAMYLFPRLTLSAKAIAAAKEAGKQPDMFYCLNLLKETGLVVVPGSGFGQKAGTYHFRTTFLPPEDQVAAVSERLAKFHKKWLAEYPLN